MILRIPGNGDVPIPLVVPSDAGHFVKDLAQLPAGTNLIAFGDRLTWSDYVKLWSRVTGRRWQRCMHMPKTSVMMAVIHLSLPSNKYVLNVNQ